MATSFRGLYLCLPKRERPSHVRVQDAEQGETILTLDAYETHGGQPPWQSLPWQGEASADDSDGREPEISL